MNLYNKNPLNIDSEEPKTRRKVEVKLALTDEWRYCARNF